MTGSFVEDIHVVGEKGLEMVVKRTFRPVANFGKQSLAQRRTYIQ